MCACGLIFPRNFHAASCDIINKKSIPVEPKADENRLLMDALYDLARDLRDFYLSAPRNFDKAGNLEYLKFQKVMQKHEPIINSIAHTAGRREVAEEIFREIEKTFGYYAAPKQKATLCKIIIDEDGYFGRPGSLKEWQALKDRFLKE